MLKELCFCPQILDESSNEGDAGWADHLRELGRSMFPRDSVCPFVVSNLYGGSWHREASEAVKAIRSESRRLDVQKLLSQVDNVLVTRPARGGWPNSEAMWAKEAFLSGATDQERIDRVVACAQTAASWDEPGSDLFPLPAVSEDRFWQGMTSDDSPPYDIDEQILRLRLICLHSQFVSFASPHIYGGDNDETDFAKALIRCIASRPKDYPSAIVDVHTQGPRMSADDPGFNDALSHRKVSVVSALRDVVPSEGKTRLWLWPKFNDRVLLAGEMAGSGKPKIRWGVHCGHIARVRDDPGRLTEWKLLRRPQVGHWRRVFYEPAPGKLLDGPIAVA